MSGSPAIKLGFWLVFNAFPFLLPNNVVLFYGYIARVASVMFLFIQLLLLLDFILAVNDAWVQQGEEDERHYKAMLAVTAACYVGCIVLIGATVSGCLCLRVLAGACDEFCQSCCAWISGCYICVPLVPLLMQDSFSLCSNPETQAHVPSTSP